MKFVPFASCYGLFLTPHGRALDGPFNIVRLLGVCTQQKPYLMIMELMAKGDLKSLLRDSRPKVGIA